MALWEIFFGFMLILLQLDGQADSLCLVRLSL